MTSRRIRTLIVDDEPVVRWGLRSQLEKHSDIEVVGECTNGLEAVTAIQELRPDLVFLDIQMPELDGFGVVDAIGVEQMPTVVFVTAHDQYALRAFDVHALDYMLKPFDDDRFQGTLRRAKAQLEPRGIFELKQHLATLIAEHVKGRKYLERFVVKSRGRIFFLPAREIDWIESADNYVELHVGKESHLLRETLTNLEARLDPDAFVRVRYSAIVNVTRIKELQSDSSGEYLITLHSGAQLYSSRRYRKGLDTLLKQ
jgi:two-component system LytT family response regulator